MKIDPPRLPTAASPAKIESDGAAFPASPTPAGPSPVPVPYPSTSDAFERVKPNPLGALLGGAATKVGAAAAQGMREGHLEGSAGLKVFAEKVQTLNDPKGEIREALTAVRESTQDSGPVADDSQLANVELQDVLQKQQQALQTMSNISKMLHDTAIAVTRKLGG